MTKTLKNKSLIIFIALLLVCSVVVGVLSFANNFVSATDNYDKNEFSVQDDASIRLLGESGNGIRFTIKLGSATYESSNKGDNLGVLIFPAKYLTDNTDANYYGGTDYINVAKKLNFEPGTYASNNVQLGSDGYYYCSASITDLKEESCAIDFVAVAYIRSGTEGAYTYNYSTIPVGKSIVSIVKSVYASSSYFGGDDSISDGYIDNYRSVLESYYERGAEELKSSLLGLGTETIPYLIRSDADWATLASEVEAGESFQGKYFRLTQDISVSNVIGNYIDAENNKPFAGVLDGNGKTITANINQAGDYVGLIAYNRGTIKNITTASSSIEGESIVGAISGIYNVGGIVAVNEGSVINCINKADIFANAVGAGIIAINLSSDELVGCINEGNVSIKTNVAAGIIAKNTANAIITNCRNSGTITYSESAGTSEKIAGLVSWNDSGSLAINNSVNNGEIKGDAIQVGGFVGWNGAPLYLYGCVNNGAVSNNGTTNKDNNGNITSINAEIGGFVGASGAAITIGDYDNEGVIVHSQNTGNISSNGNVAGGFVGFANCAVTIQNATNNGNITTLGAYGDVPSGGLIGQASNGTVYITNSSNNGIVNSASHRVGGIIGASYEEASVIIDSTSNSGAVCGTYEIGGLLGFASGNLTIQNNCKNMGDVSGGDHIAGILGSFNKDIKNLVISNTQNQGNITSTGAKVAGFVGSILNAASTTITDCVNGYATLNEGQAQITINVQWNSAAGFVGACQSSLNISNSQNHADINAADVGGGLIGYANKGTITVTNCLNEGNLPFTANRVGGIIGGAYAAAPVTISETINRGNLSGTYEVGGFIGYASGSVTINNNCENSGEIKCTQYDNIGGFVGKFECKNGELIIADSTNSGKINAVAIAGGFVGNINGAKVVAISNCTNSGAVIGTGKNLGGFVGLINAATETKISGCTNNGVVESTLNSTSDDGVAGGIVGQTNVVITLENCINHGNITANKTRNIGGLVGKAGTSITFTNCKNGSKTDSLTTGIVTGNVFTGGILGFLNGGTATFTDCINEGDVTTVGERVGGFVGRANSTIIIDTSRDGVSYNKGNITAGGAKAGGAIGYSVKNVVVTINNFSNYGTVKASGISVGGLVGCVDGTFTLTNCSNSGAVTTDKNNAGGLIGCIASGTYTNCSNSGTITAVSTTATADTGSADLYIGYLFGKVTGTLTAN